MNQAESYSSNRPVVSRKVANQIFVGGIILGAAGVILIDIVIFLISLAI